MRSGEGGVKVGVNSYYGAGGRGGEALVEVGWSCWWRLDGVVGGGWMELLVEVGWSCWWRLDGVVGGGWTELLMEVGLSCWWRLDGVVGRGKMEMLMEVGWSCWWRLAWSCMVCMQVSKYLLISLLSVPDRDQNPLP